MRKKRSIRYKITTLLLTMVLAALFLTGVISVWSLYSMKSISADNNKKLGQNAAKKAQQELETMSGEKLLETAVDKATHIEERFAEVTAYVHGIASHAQAIYPQPQNYPNRQVALPQKDSTVLAAQLIRSPKLAG